MQAALLGMGGFGPSTSNESLKVPLRTLQGTLAETLKPVLHNPIYLKTRTQRSQQQTSKPLTWRIMGLSK